jgi:methylthioribose-1-phosphate isomerase
MTNSLTPDLLEEVLSPLRFVPNEGRGELQLLDQRRLPTEETWVSCRTVDEVATAIRDMTVRGAPAIGIAAAYGVAIGARAGEALDGVIARLQATRPTAVNLFWALKRMKRRAHAGADALTDEALAIHIEDIEACRAIGRHGAPLLPEGTILTHCNAGALATGGYGTALGVIRAAVAAGKRISVYADETRPFLQGARLTAWELMRSGIDVKLITDNMAAALMRRGEIQGVVVGADRIARSGDTANKIGTYGVALAARAHGLPMLVAAPRSTVDLATSDGSAIPIEERDPREVTHLGGTAVAPTGVAVRNPAFDVTPAELVTAIVTEAGVARAPYSDTLPSLFQEKR